MTGAEMGLLAGGISLLILVPLLLRGMVLMLFAGLKVIVLLGLIAGVIYLNDPIKGMLNEKNITAQINNLGEDKIHQLIAEFKDSQLPLSAKKYFDEVK